MGAAARRPVCILTASMFCITTTGSATTITRIRIQRIHGAGGTCITWRP